MLNYLLKLLRWLFQKFAAAALIVALALAAGGLWLFLKDNVSFEQWRQDVVRALNGQRAETVAAKSDVEKRMAKLAADIQAEQERARLADAAVAKLKDLESMWDRYVGNPEQQKANAQQIEKLTETRLALQEKIKGLQRDLTRATWERDGLDVALGKLDAQIIKAEAQRSRIEHYLERTWNHSLGRGFVRAPVKYWVYAFLALYFVGPTLGKLTLYSVVAPRISEGKPVRLAEEIPALPEVSGSRVALELALTPGERLWIKEKFLQASDEGLRRKTRLLLDWSIPFTCVATGLIELIEMRHEASSPAEHLVTLSNQSDPHSELAFVRLPAGASLILRPSFLAGVVLAKDASLKIRRRWQLFRWQSWVTLQFRFFEFVGPGSLIVAGSRGVRVERLADRPGDAVPARRTNQDATMGFTPNLDYRPVRAETFWSYYRGMNPLFDDLFSGRGIFLCQQVAAPGDAKKARKFWATVWGGVMRIFGI